MNIYIDLITRQAVNGPTDATPAVRPDLRASTTYPINLYFLRQNGTGGYAYVRFPNSVIKVGLRSSASVEVARFTLSFRGATTSEIDTRFSTNQIKGLLEALPTVGVGNVEVTKDDRSITVEFVGALSGTALPTMSARIVSSTPAGAELKIEVLPLTDNAANSRQTLTLRRPALAEATTWTEVTTGTTPGWTGTLDTTSVPVSAWENPIGNLSLVVSLTALAVRSAADGVTTGDAVGRSGADGQVITSPGASGTALMMDNGSDSFLIASDTNSVYGRKFVPNDVGRGVTNTDGYVYSDATIAEVLDDGVTNMARLSLRFTPNGIGLGTIIDFTLGVLPSDVYYSATANFTPVDVGHTISGDNIVAGTRILAWINSQYVRLSQRPTAISVALPWTVTQEISNIFTSPSGPFQPGDVGAKLRAPAILDGEATITRYYNATQVELDKRPKVSTSSVPWTVIPVRSYPPASVSRLIAGDVTGQEVQKIALSQAAIGGTLTIQDGYGGTMPLVVVSNPVATSDLEIELRRAYTNYGGVSVQEVVPGAEWNVIFGKAGGQRLLIVDESQAAYQGAVLDWIVADKTVTPPTELPDVPETVPPKTHLYGLYYIGADPNNLTTPIDVNFLRITRITDGTNARMLRRRIMMLTSQYTAPAMNATYQGYYFIGDEGLQDRNGICTADWVYVTKPADRTETHNQQRTIMVPLWQKTGNVVIDWQLISTSASTWVDVKYHYYLEASPPALPNDSQIAVVIHFSTVGGVEYRPVLWTPNGFDRNVGNWGKYLTQGWSRRRWMGHVWEQKVFWN